MSFIDTVMRIVSVFYGKADKFYDVHSEKALNYIGQKIERAIVIDFATFAIGVFRSPFSVFVSLVLTAIFWGVVILPSVSIFLLLFLPVVNIFNVVFSFFVWMAYYLPEVWQYPYFVIVYVVQFAVTAFFLSVTAIVTGYLGYKTYTSLS